MRFLNDISSKLLNLKKLKKILNTKKIDYSENIIFKYGPEIINNFENYYFGHLLIKNLKNLKKKKKFDNKNLKYKIFNDKNIINKSNNSLTNNHFENSSQYLNNIFNYKNSNGINNFENSNIISNNENLNLIDIYNLEKIKGLYFFKINKNNENISFFFLKNIGKRLYLSKKIVDKDSFDFCVRKSPKSFELLLKGEVFKKFIDVDIIEEFCVKDLEY